VGAERKIEVRCGVYVKNGSAIDNNIAVVDKL